MENKVIASSPDTPRHKNRNENGRRGKTSSKPNLDAKLKKNVVYYILSEGSN